ncbi:MAG: MBL fold metallo-hydrolase [Bradymonadia bacterium]
MQIEFIAHATFLLQLDDGRRIIIDPYKSNEFSGRFNYPPFKAQCDVVCITHEHIDHSYTGDLWGNFRIVRDQYEDEGLRISSVRACHDTVGGTRFGGYIDMKIIEADGLRLCHAGDLGEILSDEQVDALAAIDILILPVGGYYTIDAAQALENAAKVAPKMLIPCHYASSLCTLPIAPLSAFTQLIDTYSEADLWRQGVDAFSKVLLLRERVIASHESFFTTKSPKGSKSFFYHEKHERH